MRCTLLLRVLSSNLKFYDMFLKYCFLVFICTVIILWSILHDDIRCIVKSSSKDQQGSTGKEVVDGYYLAKGGIYINIATNLRTIPDIFQILSIHSTWSKDTTVILQDKHEWGIYMLGNHNKLYYNRPLQPQEYLFYPPPNNWRSITPNGPDLSSSIHVHQCIGSLADSDPLVPERSQTNIQILLNRPITTILCCLILGIAYYLWSQRIEVSSVSYSYDAIINREEYWRFFTASFSHFDLLHLAFNLMSLYQLGSLEPIYSSSLFMTLNFTLVVLTMIIATCIYHYLIYSWNRHELMYQQAVGYSCVLFAWMVAASVRMKEYCPLFFLPSLCFTTYFIHIPFLPFSLNLPINFGPFVLLIITKFILPRSSLTGHLSGIIIGFPLAWNWLNFLTPNLVITLIAIFLLFNNRLFVWRFPGYASHHSFSELEEFVPSDSLFIHSSIRYLTILLAITTLLFSLTTMTISISTILLILSPRCILLLFIGFSNSAMRCLWFSDLQTVHLDSALLISISCLMSCLQSILDFFSFFGLLMTKELVLSSLVFSYEVSTARSMYWFGVLFFLLLTVLEFLLTILLLQALHKIKLVEPYLIPLQLDRQSFNRLLKSLGVTSTTPFSSTPLSNSSPPLPPPLPPPSPPPNFPSNRSIPSSNSHRLPSSQSARAAIARQAVLPALFSGNRTKTKSTTNKKKTHTNQSYNSLPTQDDSDEQEEEEEEGIEPDNGNENEERKQRGSITL